LFAKREYSLSCWKFITRNILAKSGCLNKKPAKEIDFSSPLRVQNTLFSFMVDRYIKRQV